MVSSNKYKNKISIKERRETKKEKLYFPFLQQVTDYLAVSKDISQWFSIFGHRNDHQINQFLVK